MQSQWQSDTKAEPTNGLGAPLGVWAPAGFSFCPVVFSPLVGISFAALPFSPTKRRKRFRRRGEDGTSANGRVGETRSVCPSKVLGEDSDPRQNRQQPRSAEEKSKLNLGLAETPRNRPEIAAGAAFVGVSAGGARVCGLNHVPRRRRAHTSRCGRVARAPRRSRATRYRPRRGQRSSASSRTGRPSVVPTRPLAGSRTWCFPSPGHPGDGAEAPDAWTVFGIGWEFA